MTSFELDSFLPYRLAVLSARISEGFARHYRDAYGISVAEWRVVAHLSQERVVSVREVCQRVNMDKPKVSRAASRLEAAGYVHKKTSAKDRRLVELSLTPKGWQMMEALTPIAKAYDDELIAALGPNGDMFRSLVEQMSRALHRH